ncbi:hypothetical protein LCGC14_2873000, partial [marine sediment metagenome]
RYSIDNRRFAMLRTGFSKMIFLYIILSGILPWLALSLENLSVVLGGLVFFSVPVLLTAITGLPFDFYHSFILEERYGFNTKTIRTWISDLIKAALVISIIGAFLIVSILLMIEFAGKAWWIWAWSFFICFQLLMTIFYPSVIAPIFNRFTPLEDNKLVNAIEQLAKSEGLKLQGIYQMDATRRTRHTNAYVSGIGNTKRIVLFDSLVQAHTQEEVLAILGHEIGHIKKNHIKMKLISLSLITLFLFFLASKLLTWDLIFHSFGFSLMPPYVGLFLAGILWEPVGFLLSPVEMAISRKFEHEADCYSVRISGGPAPLSAALRKMARENLSNLWPHPLYIFFNYSHPPMLKRIEYLNTCESK